MILILLIHMVSARNSFDSLRPGHFHTDTWTIYLRDIKKNAGAEHDDKIQFTCIRSFQLRITNEISTDQP
jgi:hypothetical protein